MDGGGGQSQGGQFLLKGTLSQPDTGSMSGGVYTLNGGFWNAAGADSPPEIDVYLPIIIR